MDNDDMDGSLDMLATRRSRRSTAGNRMAAVMAEVAQDDTLKELDNDVEFVNAVDEQDVFGSDFESTDEEAENQAEQEGEAAVIQEEKRIRKVARSRLEKATAAAHAKHKVTFNPEIQVSSPVQKQRIKPKQHTHTAGKRVRQSKTRTSKRMHTVLNTSATVTRLKQSEQKKATQPRKAKAEIKTYTQAELIAMALDTEEGNIREHKDYLKNEEEKRKRARVVRTNVEGPKLRWVSKIENVQVVVPPPDAAPSVAGPGPFPAAYRSIYGPPGTLFTPTTYSYTSGSLVKTSKISTPPPNQEPSTNPTFAQYSPYFQAPFSVWPTPSAQPFQSSSATPTSTSAPPAFTTQLAPEQSISAPTTTPTNPASSTTLTLATQLSTNPLEGALMALPEPQTKTESVTKNYLVHELAQERGTPKPSWADNMQALFGDHVKWDELKVLVGKNRPLSRPKQTCPITGRQARYLDPRSGVPYANSHAFKVLGQLLKHEYVWNPSTGLYLGYSEPESNDQIADAGGRERMDAD